MKKLMIIFTILAFLATAPCEGSFADTCVRKSKLLFATLGVLVTGSLVTALDDDGYVKFPTKEVLLQSFQQANIAGVDLIDFVKETNIETVADSRLSGLEFASKAHKAFRKYEQKKWPKENLCYVGRGSFVECATFYTKEFPSQAKLPVIKILLQNDAELIEELKDLFE